MFESLKFYCILPQEGDELFQVPLVMHDKYGDPFMEYSVSQAKRAMVVSPSVFFVTVPPSGLINVGQETGKQINMFNSILLKVHFFTA